MTDFADSETASKARNNKAPDIASGVFDQRLILWGRDRLFADLSASAV
jgi:hypothetical protein